MVWDVNPKVCIGCTWQGVGSVGAVRRPLLTEKARAAPCWAQLVLPQDTAEPVSHVHGTAVKMYLKNSKTLHNQ